MTSKQRLVTAIEGKVPDRLPATTHHVMPYFLEHYMGGITNAEFFQQLELDPIVWTVPHRPDKNRGEYYDPDQGPIGFLESRRIATDQWRISSEAIEGRARKAARYNFHTPGGVLSMVLESNDQT